MSHHNFTLMLMAFIKDRPGVWLPATTFEQFGRQAWRTRLSEARKKFQAAHDGTIENRQRWIFSPESIKLYTVSEYMYVPEIGAVEPSQGHDTNAATPGRLL